MSLIDWLRDLFGPRNPGPLTTEADRVTNRLFEDQMRERRELAAARRVIGRWGGDAIAAGLSRQLGVPVAFRPDHEDVVAVRDALRDTGMVSR